VLCYKPSSHKEQRNNSIPKRGDEKDKTLLSTDLGQFFESQMCPNPKKSKLGPKTVGCIFLVMFFIALAIGS
jgi:hypothetical protein